ncbi:MAG: 16S rRNA (cytosine(1402)-N(4))-methyltransferase RsmH [Peptococcaceae bacterium]|jgi:16S rRNA (cytosine1402-N4)-methyltransferase|nr:16S rRNA (cytosine(1402)-N(4))-methyltransferase RsmH [Peptococcaceae bacterium]
MEFKHISVLLEETVDMLLPQQGKVFVDCTMGGAGHSRYLLEQSAPNGKLIAIDQDGEACAEGKRRLAEFGDRVEIVQANFSELSTVLAERGISGVDGIMMDLGVSSYQLDNKDRGFSYMQDAALDMRMNPTVGKTAADILNTATEDELNDIFWLYGEEKWARRIAKFVVAERENESIETTGQLVAIIKKAVPAGARQEDQHPAKRCFQALRIAVNDELGVLERVLPAAVACLNPGGRLCVISFHSLEDRIVKNIMKELAKGCTCPPQLPVCVCGKKPQIKIISRKPILPGAAEIAANPRARSAKLRVAEKF